MGNFVLVSVLLSIISYLYLKIAIKYKIIDKPNDRSSHSKITVRGGGIIFTIAILLFFLLNDFKYPYFCLGVLLVSVISFLDDIYTLSSKIRFPFQFLAIFLILLEVGLPFTPIYIFIFTLAFGIGVVNMFNFMDGINGITGLYSLTTLVGFYFINVNEQLIDSDLLIYAIISILIFGFYNFRKKALFFAGDIGSITIGMLVFFVGLYFMFILESPLILLLVLVYGADAGNTLLYRKIFTRESIFDPHRHHLYQKLVNQTKMSHLQVSLIYTFIQILVNVIVLNSYKLAIQLQIFIFMGFVFVFMVSYLFLFNILKNVNNIKNNLL
ncbi:glycosyltransferase family 4 protein [Polaribacter vadi]|uniref:MraY family glycosyltransferase n=1 Tax=Polaribacter vadi TaxID=1774273 RepID=UPI0030EB6042|tara:strand:+ start:26763 stop:27740 length:978 start_codon:yes stop_codon:yes gene_type:complete